MEIVSYDFNYNMLLFIAIAKPYKKFNRQNKQSPAKSYIGSQSYFSFQILVSQLIVHICLEKQWLVGSILGSWPSHFSLSLFFS